MDSLQEKVEYDDHVLDESSSTHQKNLLDLPDEVIEMIFDTLNFIDQEIFSVCCKKIHKIFKSRSKFVWLKIQDPEKAIDLTRPYGKVIWECDEVPEVEDEVWRHLAPSLKALIIRGGRLDDIIRSDEDDEDTTEKSVISLASESLIDAFPFFGNIVHWEFVSGNWFVEYMEEMPVYHFVEMGKLEHLKIDSSVFSILNDRFINFSTETLKTLILNIDNSESQQEGTEGLNSFISRQKKLEILRLKGRNVGSFFDELLNLESIHLKEIEIIMTNSEDNTEGLNGGQQDNFADFMESQKDVELRNYKLSVGSVKTHKMVNFHMSQLDLPMISVKFSLVWHEQRYIESDTTEYNYLEFWEYAHAHRENLVTENLDVTFELGILDNDILSRLCYKFPNLKKLRIKAETNCRNPFYTMTLRALDTLEFLEKFELTWFPCENGEQEKEILSKVTIPNLKKFAFHQNFIMDSIRRSTDLNNFLARHENITHLKLISPSPSTYDDWEKTGYADVLKFAVETLKELKFVEATWCQDSQLFDKIEQAMKWYARPGLVLKLNKLDGVTLTLTKGDTNNVRYS